MRNLKLTVAYDGTDFHGFQTQSGSDLRTVQQTLTDAWKGLTGEDALIVGAGRTDTGVHATGQVVNLRSEHTSIPDARVPYALNTLLDEDVTVHNCEPMHESFHARFDAVSKMYEYTIYNNPFPSPLHRRYSYFVRVPLDVEAMADAASHLVGRHDFAALSGNNRTVRSTLRTISACRVFRNEAMVTLQVEADGFLYHMVRNIVGTLLCVGKGEREAEWVKDVMASGNRSLAGPTAPAQGLVLRYVRYS